jgi:endoribonuclease Dicer
LLESYQLASSIQIYADKLKSKQTEEYKLAEKEGRLPGQYWLEIEPPKVRFPDMNDYRVKPYFQTLSDVVESIVGAIYISDDFSPIGVESLFDNVLKPFYDRHITLKTLSHHPTKILFELFQAQGCQQFEITREKEEDVTQCDVVVHDVILASATDTTATLAARRASLSALDALEGDAVFMARTCDCRTNTQARKGKKQVLDQVMADFGDEEENIPTV